MAMVCGNFWHRFRVTVVFPLQVALATLKLCNDMSQTNYLYTGCGYRMMIMIPLGCFLAYSPNEETPFLPTDAHY